MGFLFKKWKQQRNCLHFVDVKESMENEPRLLNQSKAGLEGVWAGTQMGPLTSSWSGTEAMDRGCVHRENNGLPKGQRMFAPQCLLPSTCLSFWLVAFGRHLGFSRVCDSV